MGAGDLKREADPGAMGAGDLDREFGRAWDLVWGAIGAGDFDLNEVASLMIVGLGAEAISFGLKLKGKKM